MRVRVGVGLRVSAHLHVLAEDNRASGERSLVACEDILREVDLLARLGWGWGWGWGEGEGEGEGEGLGLG